MDGDPAAAEIDETTIHPVPGTFDLEWVLADEDVTQGLSIAEGIETALALWCWRWRPIWALGSAGAMEGFPILPGITALTVFTDNDASGTGLKAAKACQRRWCDARIETKVFMPRGKGCDWADEWAVR